MYPTCPACNWYIVSSPSGYMLTGGTVDSRFVCKCLVGEMTITYGDGSTGKATGRIMAGKPLPVPATFYDALKDADLEL